MRRLRATRAQVMARRTGDSESISLSPRARRIGGWFVAVLLVIGIAVVVRVLGGNGDGAGVVPAGSSLPSGSDVAPIAFGTALDPASGEVAADARSDRFADGDPFVYSVSPSDLGPGNPVPVAVYVRVERTGGGALEVAQEAVEAQKLPDPRVIAFSVPTADLLADFGPGEYLMVIYADPAAAPIAEGAFRLIGTDVSPAASP